MERYFRVAKAWDSGMMRKKLRGIAGGLYHGRQ